MCPWIRSIPVLWYVRNPVILEKNGDHFATVPYAICICRFIEILTVCVHKPLFHHRAERFSLWNLPSFYFFYPLLCYEIRIRPKMRLPLFREFSQPKSIDFTSNPCNCEFCVRLKDLLMQISQWVHGHEGVTSVWAALHMYISTLLKNCVQKCPLSINSVPM